MVEGLNNSVEDLNELFELSEDESEANQLKEELLNVEEKIADLEFRRMFSGKMDQANTYLDIQSGSCLLYTSPSPRDLSTSRMPSSA